MKDIHLVSYSVEGIKSLERRVSLSFYKKTITRDFNTREYNIKGIYGMNGSGKSAIIASVEILRNLLTNSEYLSDSIVQRNLEEMVNKKTGSMSIEAQYVLDYEGELLLFQYEVTLKKDAGGRFSVSHEKLSFRKATSRSNTMDTIFEVSDGDITFLQREGADELTALIYKRTTNLLSAASMSILVFEKISIVSVRTGEWHEENLFYYLSMLYIFGTELHVYLDQSDDHRDFHIYRSFREEDRAARQDKEIYSIKKKILDIHNDNIMIVSFSGNYVYKKNYERFAQKVLQLQRFLQIFKPELQGIEIEKKEDREFYICSLIMLYDEYRIHAEFESTGIKKLIRLYSYLREMFQGSIVFIDEFDSNLHDVYLCALLEYLMDYGEGQLCFTTHNVGPMDILKQNKKSIDFLSADGNIYPWRTNGNYSPSKLYKNGMIEGSPFNVDSTDFIGIFGTSGEDKYLTRK